MKNHLPVFSEHFPNILHHWPPHIIWLSQHVKGALGVMKPIQQHLRLFCNKGGIKKKNANCKICPSDTAFKTLLIIIP